MQHRADSLPAPSLGPKPGALRPQSSRPPSDRHHRLGERRYPSDPDEPDRFEAGFAQQRAECGDGEELDMPAVPKRGEMAVYPPDQGGAPLVTPPKLSLALRLAGLVPLGRQPTSDDF